MPLLSTTMVGVVTSVATPQPCPHMVVTLLLIRPLLPKKDPPGMVLVQEDPPSMMPRNDPPSMLPGQLPEEGLPSMVPRKAIWAGMDAAGMVTSMAVLAPRPHIAAVFLPCTALVRP